MNQFPIIYGHILVVLFDLIKYIFVIKLIQIILQVYK